MKKIICWILILGMSYRFLFLAVPKTHAFFWWIVGAAIVDSEANKAKNEIDKQSQMQLDYQACNQYGPYVAYIKHINKCVVGFNPKTKNAIYSDKTEGPTYGCRSRYFQNSKAYDYWEDDSFENCHK